MLAGLLIAMHDADDRPAMLTATLPFGGMTLIEYQARLLVAAGASQLVIVVARLTPELLGAINRIGRRGIAVDTVRTATEAAERLHPLARVLMLADGLTTTEETVAALAHGGGDALLVMPETAAAPGFERVGGGMVWAGAARLEARRVAELAALPRDYDLQSTLIRLAEQAQAVHMLLPPGAARSGHALSHSGAALEARGRAVLTAMVSGRSGWFERFVATPLARLTIPMMVPRGISAVAVAAGAGVAALVGLTLAVLSHPVSGLLLALVGTLGAMLAATLADLRDEPGMARGLKAAATILPMLAVLLYAYDETRLMLDGVPLTLGAGLVLLAGIGERATGRAPRPTWWGSTAAYLLVVWLGAVVEAPLVALGGGALYAAATLVAAIERLRREP